MKKTQDIYQERERIFRDECQKRLEDRLKIYDQRIQELSSYNVSANSNKTPTTIPPAILESLPSFDEERVSAVEAEAVVGEKEGEKDEDINFGEDDLINEIYNMNN